MTFWVVITPRVFGIFSCFDYLTYNYEVLKENIKPFQGFYEAVVYLQQTIPWSERFALGLDTAARIPINQWISRTSG